MYEPDPDYDKPDYTSYEDNPIVYNWHLSALGGTALGLVALKVAPLLGSGDIVTDSAAGIAFGVGFVGLRKLFKACA